MEEGTKKIAVAGATGRVGRHTRRRAARSGATRSCPSRGRAGVDVITGEGLAEALAGVECVIDAATGPSPEQEAATAFFTTAARNLHEAGARAGVQRMVVVSIIGIDRFTAGYNAAKVAQERGDAVGPDPGAGAPGGAVPRVRRPARGVGHAGRRELRAADAHPAGRRAGPSPRRSPTSPPDRATATGTRSPRSPGRGRSSWPTRRRCWSPGRVAR